MKTVYPLRFPSASEMFAKEFLHSILSTKDRDKTGYVRQYPANEILNSDYQNYMNIEWDIALVFLLKHDTSSLIHSDATSGRLNWSKSRVGVNWILNNDCSFESWHFEHVKEIEQMKITPDHDALSKKSYVPIYTPLTPPDNTYLMQKDHVYLTNALYPHRAVSYGDRINISLRSHDFQENRSWDDVVEYFKDYIVW